MDMILKTTGLCKNFKEQMAVNNVSLNIRRNSVYGLLGPNGAGKSTTLKMITGILRPTSGSIEFDGHPWQRSDLTQIGALIETPPLYENLTAYENLKVRTTMLRLPDTRIDEVLHGFQYMTFYWWYAFLLPGTIAILCSISHQKEERAGKYYSVFSAPISLKRFEYAKALILVEKVFVAAVFLAVFATVSNLISPALAVYSVSRNFIGSIAVVITSIWQIPICLLLTRKTGLLFPIAANTLLGILMPILLGNTALSWVCPYCWAAKTAELIMGIESNGTFSGVAAFSWVVLLPLVFSVILYALLTLWDAEHFSEKEGK